MGFRESRRPESLSSVSNCSPLHSLQFASVYNGSRAEDTCGQTPRPGKGRSGQSSSNKVKGAVYYAALQAAGLIRASVSCGACVGDSEAGFHLGSVPCGCPGLSSQNMNWGRSRGSRNTEEVPGASGRPTRAVHHLCLRSDFHWCSLKLGTKQIAETFLLFVGHTPPCFPSHCRGLRFGATQEEREGSTEGQRPSPQPDRPNGHLHAQRQASASACEID